jgi:hypothetical protein
MQQRLELAVAGLEQALSGRDLGPERVPSAWRQVARQCVASVGEALSAEVVLDEAAVAARAGRLHRERRRLLDRLGSLGGRLTLAEDDPDDDERLRRHLLRLSHDISHHHQRVHDLAYDADGRDVGGSE